MRFSPFSLRVLFAPLYWSFFNIQLLITFIVKLWNDAILLCPTQMLSFRMNSIRAAYHLKWHTIHFLYYWLIANEQHANSIMLFIPVYHLKRIRFNSKKVVRGIKVNNHSKFVNPKYEMPAQNAAQQRAKIHSTHVEMEAKREQDAKRSKSVCVCNVHTHLRLRDSMND